MISSTRLLVVLFGIFLFTVTVHVDATCKRCSTTSLAACINETAFTVCFDGTTLSDHVGTCATGYVCTTEAGVCKLRTEANPDCGACGVCTNGFACRSKSTFEYCNGKTLTGILAKCPSRQYCSLTSLIQTRNICRSSCNTEPTCYRADEE